MLYKHHLTENLYLLNNDMFFIVNERVFRSIFVLVAACVEAVTMETTVLELVLCIVIFLQHLWSKRC